MLERARWASRSYSEFSTADVNRIVRAVSEAAHDSAHKYAEWAVRETTFGVVEHKVIKNQACSRGIVETYAEQDYVAPRIDSHRKIIEVATGRFGIPAEDILIDPLAMPIGADTSLVVKTLETIALLAAEFGVNMTLGASNVSFGMPERHAIGAAFLPIAISNGLTSAILDARSPQIVRAVKAADLLLDRDPWGASWIAAHRAAQAAAQAAQGQAQQAPAQQAQAGA